uniref:Uncharacterized protein n=1 Tax=Acrobeloides nanus TaxID=290746 RepID=A0A914DRI3_9BILA
MNWMNNLKTVASAVKNANEIYQEINTRIQSTNILASSSNSNKCNNEIKIEKIQLTNFDRVDLQTGFSVYKARSSPICYHVVLVEGGLSVYRAPDQNAAEIIRDKLNRIRGVATEAARNQMLERLLQLYYEHPKWEEVHYASYLGLPSYLDFLCSTRDPLIVVNTTNIEDGRFPIHLAAEKNLLSTVKKLLGYGADFTKCDLDGRNVIHYAAKDSVSILTELSKRPDFNTALNKQDDHGLLPLHYACEAGNVETVFVLLKHSEGSLTSGGSVRNIIEFMSGLTQPLSSGQQK